MKVNRKLKTAIGTSVGFSVAALVYYAWYNRHDLKSRFKEWKNERIKNAFYDTLEQKDIVWG